MTQQNQQKIMTKEPTVLPMPYELDEGVTETVAGQFLSHPWSGDHLTFDNDGNDQRNIVISFY